MKSESLYSCLYKKATGSEDSEPVVFSYSSQLLSLYELTYLVNLHIEDKS